MSYYTELASQGDITIPVMVAAFVIGYSLRLIGVAQHKDAQLKVAYVLTAALASVAAFMVTTGPNTGVILDIFGRLAVFFLVGFVGGVCIAIGLALAQAPPWPKKTSTD